MKSGVNTVTIAGTDSTTQLGIDVMWPGVEVKVAYALPYTGLTP